MSSKIYKFEERFNDDPHATIFRRYGEPRWYFRIKQKPGIRRGNWSLHTEDRETAIIEAKKKYQDLMEVNQTLKNSLFNPEDIKIATLRKGLGRLCEDKFKNLMMVKGYQVYTPVEDIWGSDFLISKNAKDFERIQVKSTSQTGKMNFHLITNHADKIPYKQIVDQMAFISIMDDTVWLVPVENLPDKTVMSLTELKRDYGKFKVTYSGV